MTYLNPMPKNSDATAQVRKAHLLFDTRATCDIDRIGAAFIEGLGLPATSLQNAFEDIKDRKLVLRTDHGVLVVYKSPTPMGAEHFNRAIPPFANTEEREAMMANICQHETAITLKIKTDSQQIGDVDRALHRAVQAVSRLEKPIAILWDSTQRLHQGEGFDQILGGENPVKLFLAPSMKTLGPRKLPILDFIGAQGLLGFSLNLQMINFDRNAAINAGFEFARNCMKNPAARNAKSFDFEGRTMRLIQTEDGVSLIPVALSNLQSLIEQAGLKTAA